MKHQKPFLLIIEATQGLNTHATYTTYDEANKEKSKAFAQEQEPICIYDLNSLTYVWENNEFPLYGETIVNNIVKSYLNKR